MILDGMMEGISLLEDKVANYVETSFDTLDKLASYFGISHGTCGK